MNERIKEKVKLIDWERLQKISEEKNLSKDAFYKEFKVGVKLVKYAISVGLIDFSYYVRKHTQETKKLFSKQRKKYLIENPDKHVWKRKEKSISEPCEIFKTKLIEANISFVEEFTPLKERFFSIDIAFPDKKIGIEINGNQHYNSNGSLKDYYQKRHDAIENEGWILYEYHYSVAFDNLLIEQIISNLKINNNLENIDYSFYIVKKVENLCCDCNTQITPTSVRCKSCNNKNIRITGDWRKIKDRPNIDLIRKEVEELGYRGTGKKYGVSDNAIRNWLK